MAVGEIRFGDRAPVAILLVDCNHVVGVMFRFQIKDQGRIAVRPQSGGGK